MDSFRRRVLSSSAKGIPIGESAPVGSVLFVNNSNTSEKMFFEQSNWPSSGWTPIGICVIPANHNRYSYTSNINAVMSLVCMDPSNPESGSVTSTTVQWGGKGTLIGNGMGTYTYALTEANSNIPTQYYDEDTNLYAVNLTRWPYYDLDPRNDSKSTVFSAVNAVGATNKAGEYFNGRLNTASAYVTRRTSVEWTDASINTAKAKNLVAFACCGRFKTIGTSSFYDLYNGITSVDNGAYVDSTGFWYLPASGEICYIPPRQKRISSIINALNDKYGQVAAELGTYWWCSTQYDANSAWVMNSAGYLYGPGAKNVDRQARAFMLI